LYKYFFYKYFYNYNSVAI